VGIEVIGLLSLKRQIACFQQAGADKIDGINCLSFEGECFSLWEMMKAGQIYRSR
jgi:hypothetical protein